MAPILRARYRVAVDCRPEVPVPRSTDGLLPGFVETYCGAGLRPGAGDPYSPRKSDLLRSEEWGMDRSVAQATAISQAIREDVAEVAVAVG